MKRISSVRRLRTASRLVLSPAIHAATVAAALVIALSPMHSADAAVVSTTGSVVPIAPPPNVALGFLESNSEVQFFNERSGLLLSQPLTVDITQPGLVDDLTDLTFGAISADQRIDSYLLHADALGSSNSSVMFQGSVTFDAPILGALVRAAWLTESDTAVGSPTTIYYPNANRGFEFGAQTPAVSDSLVLSPDRFTVSFIFRTTSQSDQIRIVTAAIPEPFSAWLVVSSCVALSLSRLTRR